MRYIYIPKGWLCPNRFWEKLKYIYNFTFYNLMHACNRQYQNKDGFSYGKARDCAIGMPGVRRHTKICWIVVYLLLVVGRKFRVLLIREFRLYNIYSVYGSINSLRTLVYKWGTMYAHMNEHIGSGFRGVHGVIYWLYTVKNNTEMLWYFAAFVEFWFAKNTSWLSYNIDIV